VQNSCSRNADKTLLTEITRYLERRSAPHRNLIAAQRGRPYESTVNEGDKYRSAARRMREQADLQPDRAISEQFRKIADRYDELAEQVEAAARRAD
jgi:hypothetical protein